MKWFQVTAIWQQPGNSIQEVEEEVFNRLGHGELEEDVLDGAITELRVDAAEIPRSAGGSFDLARASAADASESLMNETPDHMSGAPETSGLLPPAGVTHPWDRGSWIFPEDHVLAPLERVAAAGVKGSHRDVVQDQFQAAALELGEGEVVDHED